MTRGTLGTRDNPVEHMAGSTEDGEMLDNMLHENMTGITEKFHLETPEGELAFSAEDGLVMVEYSRDTDDQ